MNPALVCELIIAIVIKSGKNKMLSCIVYVKWSPDNHNPYQVDNIDDGPLLMIMIDC